MQREENPGGWDPDGRQLSNGPRRESSNSGEFPEEYSAT